MIHYVAPSVWAWRPGRAAKMAKVVDHVLALLPFEPPYMQAAGMTCDFVGHPVAAEPQATPAEAAALRAELGVAEGQRLLVLLPGSRRGEVTRLGPVFAEVVAPPARRRPVARGGAARRRPRRRGAGRAPAARRRGLARSSTRAGFRRRRRRRASARPSPPPTSALAASGTVSLELAAAGTPMVIAYTANPLTGWLVMRMALIDTATLVNLVTDTRVVPEFFLGDCTPDKITPAVARLLDRPGRRRGAAGGGRAHHGAARPRRRAAGAPGGALGAGGDRRRPLNRLSPARPLVELVVANRAGPSGVAR